MTISWVSRPLVVLGTLISTLGVRIQLHMRQAKEDPGQLSLALVHSLLLYTVLVLYIFKKQLLKKDSSKSHSTRNNACQILKSEIWHWKSRLAHT